MALIVYYGFAFLGFLFNPLEVTNEQLFNNKDSCWINTDMFYAISKRAYLVLLIYPAYLIISLIKK